MRKIPFKGKYLEFEVYENKKINNQTG